MILAVALGLVLGIASVVGARRIGGERWMYSAILLILPIIYVVFALVDGHGSIGFKELLIGLPWILGGLAALFLDVPKSAVLVGALWILHGVFDVAHDQFFTNPGVPDWYPAACAGTDIIVGGYVLWLASRLKSADLQSA